MDVDRQQGEPRMTKAQILLQWSHVLMDVDRGGGPNPFHLTTYSTIFERFEVSIATTMQVFFTSADGH